MRAGVAANLRAIGKRWSGRQPYRCAHAHVTLRSPVRSLAGPNTDAAMDLRVIVRWLTAVIASCALASAGSLVFTTGYLHRLTTQVDANLQSVHAAEEIELQLLWHARNLNQASSMRAPARAAEASQAQVEVLCWLETAREYVGSEEEATILCQLEEELDLYFAKQAELAAQTSRVI